VKYFLRFLIFFHRWIGIALSVVFLLWFPSGIGMMYWGFPGVSAEDRLDRSPKLDGAKIVLSPEEAAEKAGVQSNPGQVRLNSFDGRPVYRFGGGGGRGGRGGSGGKIIYADTGEEQTVVSAEMLDRIASAWTGRPPAEATKISVEKPDQWTVGGQLRSRPVYKYSWPNGQQVYLNGTTGEVVQYTTFAKRVQAHLSAIPHWVYYTPLRKHQPEWLEFMIWSSIIGTVGAIVGIVIGVWMYSPKKKYRLEGEPTGVPYRGQKRWHWILGIVFGVATVTWTFSGLMTLGPFPLVQRLTQTAPRAEQQQSTASDQGSETGRGRGQGGRGRGGAPQGIAGALRGRVRMTDFSVHPRELLSKVPQLDVKELEWTSFAGTPLFNANLAGGKSQLLSLDGAPVNGFETNQLIEIVKSAVPNPNAIEIQAIDQYDMYYLDRTRQRPLPVLRVLMNDEEHTRYYIDPKSARVVSTYSSRNWVNRWLDSALHSLSFPFLYNHRPLWDIVVITFMVGGTALCVTSLVLAWRVLGRKLKRVKAVTDDVLTAET
jgi:hypothetical protein